MNHKLYMYHSVYYKCSIRSLFLQFLVVFLRKTLTKYFFAVIVTAHNITYLEVPQYGDPRRDADLICHYVNEKGDPPLHSVKWYRDNNEIFRFTPEQQVNIITDFVAKESCNYIIDTLHKYYEILTRVPIFFLNISLNCINKP